MTQQQPAFQTNTRIEAVPGQPTTSLLPPGVPQTPQGSSHALLRMLVITGLRTPPRPFVKQPTPSEAFPPLLLLWHSSLFLSSVFWDLYCAAPERRDTCEHSSEAKAFHDYKVAGNKLQVEGKNIRMGF
nr:uncharacterized protein LOC113806525 [Penaeus vannamei]